MPLSVGEAAKVGLRIRAALLTDPSSIRSSTEEDIESASEIFKLVTDAAADFAATWDLNRTSTHLLRTQDKIAERCDARLADLISGISEMQDELSGDGCAVMGVACHGRTGLLKLATEVWEQVNLLTAQSGVELDDAGKISVQAALAVLYEGIEPGSVTGDTRIKGDPRTVNIILPDRALRAADLVEIAYALFHEMICHGFQAWGRTDPENPSQSCAWSEGWMDSIAFRATCDWLIEGENRWLAVGREQAIDTARGAHGKRYAAAKLLSSDLRRRREGREANSELVRILNGLGMNVPEAVRAGDKFSFALNTHAGGYPKLYRRILEIVVRSFHAGDSDSSDAAAIACAAFGEHRDIVRLTTELQRI